MKPLHLVLKKKWYEMILSGEKKEEYREIKPYWTKRLLLDVGRPYKGFTYPKFDKVLFQLGYAKNAPTMLFEIEGLEIGNARPEWSDNWPGEVFVIELGKRLD